MQELGLQAELPIMQGPAEPCMYLPDRTAKMRYRWGAGVSSLKYEQLLARGWRRFGGIIFRADCDGCSSCISLRIPVAEFRPTKSQRRALRRNADVSVITQPVTVTQQHLDLFNAYHADMHQRRGWRRESICEDEYWMTFVEGEHDFAQEMLYYRDGQLIGVGLVDMLPSSSSGVYFYHDPQWRPLSPGTFSLLKEVEAAQAAGRSHHYLGYWVEGNQSMAYKARFQPHELLHDHVGDYETPPWEAT